MEGIHILQSRPHGRVYADPGTVYPVAGTYFRHLLQGELRSHSLIIGPQYGASTSGRPNGCRSLFVTVETARFKVSSLPR